MKPGAMNLVRWNKSGRPTKTKHAMMCAATALVKKGYSRQEALRRAKEMYIWPSGN